MSNSTQRLQEKLDELSSELTHVPKGQEAIEGLKVSLQDVISELETFKSGLDTLTQSDRSKKAA